MSKQFHEGQALWDLLEELKINKSALNKWLDLSNGIFQKWRDSKETEMDLKRLQMIRGWIKNNYGIDIRAKFPRIPEEMIDISLVEEKVNIYGEPDRVVALKNKEIDRLHEENMNLKERLNDVYNKIFTEHFNKMQLHFDTQNELMRKLIDSLAK
jgi:hypothetical protein